MKPTAILLLFLTTLACAKKKPLRHRPAPQHKQKWWTSYTRAGAAVYGSNISRIEAIVDLPRLPKSDDEEEYFPGTDITVWVGIDGKGCHPALVRVGVTVQNKEDAFGWSQWMPHRNRTFGHIEMKGGDRVQLGVELRSSTTGYVWIRNMRRNTIERHHFARPHHPPLCRLSASWMLEATDTDGHVMSLADFYRISFDQCRAFVGNGESLSLDTASVVNMKRAGMEVTECWTLEDSVVCEDVRRREKDDD